MFASANTAMPLKQLGNDDGNGVMELSLFQRMGLRQRRHYDAWAGDTAEGWARDASLKTPAVKYVLPTAQLVQLLNGGINAWWLISTG